MVEGPQQFPRPLKSNKPTSTKATPSKATEMPLAITPAIEAGQGVENDLRSVLARQDTHKELAEMRGMLAAMLQMATGPAVQPQQAEPLPDVAQASLVKRVLNSNRTNSARFLLVVVPDDDLPQLEEFPSVDELVTRLRVLIGTPCHAFPILGTRLAITGDTHKQLSTPYGSIPLFDIPVTAPVDSVHAAWLGEKPLSDNLSVSDETDDEYEDDEEE